jgi:hypothetical protein
VIGDDVGTTSGPHARHSGPRAIARSEPLVQTANESVYITPESASEPLDLGYRPFSANDAPANGRMYCAHSRSASAARGRRQRYAEGAYVSTLDSHNRASAPHGDMLISMHMLLKQPSRVIEGFHCRYVNLMIKLLKASIWASCARSAGLYWVE